MNIDFISIDRESDISIAEQIANQLFAAIINGTIDSNEKLLPERELADMLGVSRGTIKRAYSRLADAKMIDIRQGSGSYILKNQHILEENQKNEATKVIKSTFTKLNGIGLSNREIINLMNLYYLSSSKNNSLTKVNIMVLSNNHDILTELEQQLSYLTDSSPFMFTLSLLTIDIINGSPDPVQLLLNYDLIIATTIDYPIIINLAPMFKERILEMTLSPRTHTLVEFSKLPSNSQVKIIYRTNIFKDLVVESLVSVGFSTKHITHVKETLYNPVEHDEDGTNVIVNFNESPVYINPSFKERNERFISRGGKLIRFEYQIKRNSLIYIEDRIQHLLKQRFEIN